ncbi:MAG TPA: hypothetical protein VMU51_15520 [Mycobacteriales bacterium]|nr:hypothetical protein [Mycobacteriales bacterium]
MHENSRDNAAVQIPNGDEFALVSQLYRSLTAGVVSLVKAMTLPVEVGPATRAAVHIREIVTELGAALDLLTGAHSGRPSQVMTVPAHQARPGDRLIADLAVSEVFTGHPLVRHVSTVRGLTTLHHADGALAVSMHEPVLIERPTDDPDTPTPAPPEPDPADPPATGDADTPGVHSEHMRQLLADAGPDAGDVDAVAVEVPLPRQSVGDWFARDAAGPRHAVAVAQ